MNKIKIFFHICCRNGGTIFASNIFDYEIPTVLLNFHFLKPTAEIIFCNFKWDF